MGQLGDLLRETREAKGLSLEQVEQNTRIRYKLLEALEQEDYQELPAPVFVKGFLRNYALFLGLDVEQVIQLYKDAVGDTDIPYELHALREPLEPEPSRAPIYLGVFAIIALLAAAAWILVQQGWLRMPDIRTAFARPPTVTATPSASSTATNTAKPVIVAPTASVTLTKTDTAVPTRTVALTATVGPSDTASPAPTRTGTATVSLTSTSRPTGTLTATRPNGPTATRSATASTTVSLTSTRSRTPTAAKTETPTRRASSTPSGTSRATAETSGTPTASDTGTPENSTAAIRVQLEFLDTVWVRIYSDGAKIYDGEAQKGTSRDWTADEQLYVQAAYGNAVRATVNGEEYGLLGATVDPVRIEWSIAPGTPSVVSPIEPTQVVLSRQTPTS